MTLGNKSNAFTTNTSSLAQH